MNRIYRKVWSRALGQVVVASELASSQGTSISTDRRTQTDLRLLVVAITFALGVAADNSAAQVLAVSSSSRCNTLDSISVGGCADEGISVSVGARAYAANDYVVALDQVAMNGTVVGGTLMTPAQPVAAAASAAGIGQYFTANGVGDGSDDAFASGSGSMAAGVGSHALGAESTAVGSYNEASGDYATAVGYVNTALGTNSSAVGSFNQVNGENAVAFGASNFVDGANAAALGSNAIAIGSGSLALGNMAQASLERALAVGEGAKADALDSIAIGTSVVSAAVEGIAVGSNALASADKAMGLGANAKAMHVDSVALGAGSATDRDLSVSVGDAGQERQVTHVAAGTEGTDAVNLNQLNAMALAGREFGRYFTANGAGDGSDDALSLGTGAIAIGAGSVASATQSSAIGYMSKAQSLNSVALGAGSVAAEDAVVSVGGGDGITSPSVRRIVNVGKGNIRENSTDAVNGSQLYETNVKLGVVESRVDAIDSRIEGVAGIAANALTYDDGTRKTASLLGAAGTKIDNLGAGDIADGSMQAISGGQLYDSLKSMASLLGGGAGLGLQGTFIAPTYVVQNASYRTVGDAISALDFQVSSLIGRYGEGQGNTGAGVALGDGASAKEVSGTGIGHGAKADGLRDTALGNEAKVLADSSTAVGANSLIGADAENAVAVGESATVTAVNGTAIGQASSVAAKDGTAVGRGASVTAENSVALGSDALADRANTVSVGRAGNERQITNVAAGTSGTDAVNKAQLDRGIASANSYTDSKVSAINDSFEMLRGDVDKQLRHIDERIDRQGAMTAAMMNMAVSAAGVSTENRVGVGVGFQGAEKALSLGYQRAFGKRATLTVGGAFSSDDSSIGVGAGFGW